MFLKLIIVVLTIYYSSQSETSVRKSSDIMNELFRNFSKYVHSTTASSDTICIHQNDTWTKHWGTYKQFHAKKDGSNKTTFSQNSRHKEKESGKKSCCFETMHHKLKYEPDKKQ